MRGSGSCCWGARRRAAAARVEMNGSRRGGSETRPYDVYWWRVLAVAAVVLATASLLLSLMALAFWTMSARTSGGQAYVTWRGLRVTGHGSRATGHGPRATGHGFWVMIHGMGWICGAALTGGLAAPRIAATGMAVCAGWKLNRAGPVGDWLSRLRP